jgi:hypothetical protein
MCPRCGQNAPVVYRGVIAYCTSCNAPRPPLTGTSLHLAGQPSRVGGVVAKVVGWIVLGFGLTFALGLGLLFQLIMPGTPAPLVAALPTAVIALIVGIAFLRGGTSLGRRGDTAEKNARTQAALALAAHRGGTLSALDVAQALTIPLPEADALLTAIAREDYEHVSVDVDPNGTLVYRFVTASAAQAPGARVRVDPEVARSPNRAEWERLEAQAQAEREATTQRTRARVR